MINRRSVIALLSGAPLAADLCLRRCAGQEAFLEKDRLIGADHFLLAPKAYDFGAPQRAKQLPGLLQPAL